MRRVKRSPVLVSEAASAPAASSITPWARSAAAIRHGFKLVFTLTTRPSFAKKATSMANFMKNMWIALVGAMMSACPAGSEWCLSRPVRRDAESKAVASWLATILPFRSFTRTNDSGLPRRMSLRKKGAVK